MPPNPDPLTVGQLIDALANHNRTDAVLIQIGDRSEWLSDVAVDLDARVVTLRHDADAATS